MTIYSKLLLSLIALVIVFHFLVLARYIPIEVVWGGRISEDQMIPFEMTSIGINLFLAIILMVKEKVIPIRLPALLIKWILWAFMLLFALNTIGNLLARSMVEKSFALLTALFAVLIWYSLKKGH